MSYPERNQLAADLCNIIAQMHKIPNTTPYRFANVSGGPIHDHRIDSGVAGPFNSEADLNTALAGGSELQSHIMSEVPSAYTRTHDSVFTHGNLFFTNVLVDGGRLSGILDWHSSAFMPTYWECAKVMRPTWFMPAQEIYKKMWGDQFEVELEAEGWIWQRFPYWS
jgi:aminoglycoside phosphotransferase (APT) family kinase protein